MFFTSGAGTRGETTDTLETHVQATVEDHE
jgi:hypothetical protein